MQTFDLSTQIALGEDISRQFKVDVRSAASLAAEMAVFANSADGVISDFAVLGLVRSMLSRKRSTSNRYRCRLGK